MKRTILALALVAGIAAPAAADNRIDTIRPDAPALAAYGERAVGVRTLQLSNPDQPDIASIDKDAALPDPLPTVERKLTVELFYPAEDGASGDTTHDVAMRDGTMIEIAGRSVRDAKPAAEVFPLVVLSHGYPGNRFLMAHLAENLASKGYVVASVDHPASTYRDQRAFGDTLVHRPLDQIFVLNTLADMAKEGGELAGLVNADNAAIVGYSMGGYGALIASGAGVTQKAVDLPFGAPHGLLSRHLQGSDTQMKPDPRVKTIVVFGPWGRNWDLWDADGLKNISVPSLFIAGGQDDVSGYENGVRKIWEEATGSNRALLTFEGANHNAGAPMPAPQEALDAARKAGTNAPWDHYGDAVWDNVRMNNIAQHFVTAWLDVHLKGDAAKEKFLDLTVSAEDGVFAMEDGKEKPEHTYWEGFPNRSAKGLKFEKADAAQ